MRDISPDALNLLMNHDWPGNIRELENTIHRAVILTNDNVISQAHLSSILELLPRLEASAPKTAEELKRVKKAIREKSVERIEKQLRARGAPAQRLERDARAPRRRGCSARTSRR